MRIIVAVLKCFLVAVIIGSAVCDKQGGAIRMCPVETRGENDLQLDYRVVEFAKTCAIGMEGDTSLLKESNVSIVAYQTYVKIPCLNSAIFKECLDEKASSLEVCSNSTILKTFNILRDFLAKTSEMGCANGGQLFVKLIQGRREILNTKQQQLSVCLSKSSAIINAVLKTHVDVSSQIYILHREFTTFLECIIAIEFDQSFKEAYDYYKSEMSATMKCIHPQTGSLVPCVSISRDLISAPTICEAKTHNGKLDLYDVSENDASKCFHEIANMHHDSPGQNTTNYNEAITEDARLFCDKINVTLRCLEDVKYVSESCLNSTQKNELKLFLSNAENAIPSACLEDGQRLASIMYEVYRLKRTGHGHAVWDCIDVAKSTRNVTDEHGSSSKNMRFYIEMTAFKRCLVGKLHGDQTSVVAATSLINDLLKKMECAGAEDGSTVTCAPQQCR